MSPGERRRRRGTPEGLTPPVLPGMGLSAMFWGYGGESGEDGEVVVWRRGVDKDAWRPGDRVVATVGGQRHGEEEEEAKL